MSILPWSRRQTATLMEVGTRRLGEETLDFRLLPPNARRLVPVDFGIALAPVLKPDPSLPPHLPPAFDPVDGDQPVILPDLPPDGDRNSLRDPADDAEVHRAYPQLAPSPGWRHGG